MSLLPFTIATAAGSALWNAALVGAGYLLGTQWDVVGQYVSTASNIVIGALVLGLVVVLGRRAWQRNGRHAG